MKRSILVVLFLLGACQAGPSVEEGASPSPSAEVSATPTLRAESTARATEIPARSESEEYVVQAGDRLSSIAAQFGLRPQTVLWANYEMLFDNPDFLMEGMRLTILPADGLMHQVGGIDTVASIAAFFVVEAEAIVEWPGNQLDAENPSLLAGQWLFIPGGQRQSRWRQMPNVAREAAELDFVEFGLGACRADFPEGPVGDGDYGWPVESRWVRGEDFSDWHPGVDLATSSGEAVLAADDGVVVFSGWSNLGYGKLAMIDHGNGDFTLYSGLGQLLAPCGKGVAEGEAIAVAAITGYPAGAILHFEIRQGGEAVDPLALLP